MRNKNNARVGVEAEGAPTTDGRQRLRSLCLSGAQCLLLTTMLSDDFVENPVVSAHEDVPLGNDRPQQVVVVNHLLHLVDEFLRSERRPMGINVPEVDDRFALQDSDKTLAYMTVPVRVVRVELYHQEMKRLFADNGPDFFLEPRELLIKRFTHLRAGFHRYSLGLCDVVVKLCLFYNLINNRSIRSAICTIS